MEREHLLTLPSHRRRSSLSSLPENNEISIPLPFTPSQLKHHLIFGPCCSSLPSSPVLLHYPFSPPSFHDLLHKEPTFSCSSPNSPSSSSSSSDDQTQFDELPSGPPPDIASLPWPKSSLHRAKTAPAMAVINDFNKPSLKKPPPSSSQAIVRQGILLLAIYLSLGVVIYFLNRKHFVVNETHPVVDALYFCIVTMCTIGYGDIIPNSIATKLFSIMFVLVGFGFIDILLSGMVCYVLDLQENYLLKNIKADYHNSGSNRRDRQKAGKRSEIIFDVKKGRMRIRMKVALALGVVILCIGVGVGVMHFVEKLGWLDSFYLSVMSVTTVGYGDQAFHSLCGRMFACIWLLVSTLAVARAFLYLAEARVDKRNRRLAKWVLAHDMTVAEFLAADTDNNGFVSKSEYVVYKLKEMGKVAEKDIMEICRQFDRIDSGHCGKITLADLVQNHH